MGKVLALLTQIRPDHDFSASSNFFEEGMLDSFDMVTLVSEIDRAYGISVDGLDIVPENFAGVAAIEQLLRRYGVEP